MFFEPLTFWVIGMLRFIALLISFLLGVGVLMWTVFSASALIEAVIYRPLQTLNIVGVLMTPELLYFMQFCAITVVAVGAAFLIWHTFRGLIYLLSHIEL